jgi:glycosyltransferase
MHSDDMFADSRVLSRITNAFDNPSVEAVYGDLHYVSKDSPEKAVRYWRAGDFSFPSLRWGWMPPHPTFYARRAVYEKLGSFNLDYQIAADYDCMLRFLAQGNIHMAYIPEVLVRMRVGGKSNKSLKNIFRKSLEDYRAIRKNNIGGLSTLLAKNLRKLPQFLIRG